MAVVHVPPGEATRIAQQLLGWAADKGMDPGVVRTSSDGIFGFSFVVPDELIEGYKPETGDSEPEPQLPKKRGGRPRKAAVEPVVEEEE